MPREFKKLESLKELFSYVHVFPHALISGMVGLKKYVFLGSLMGWNSGVAMLCSFPYLRQNQVISQAVLGRLARHRSMDNVVRIRRALAGDGVYPLRAIRRRIGPRAA